MNQTNRNLLAGGAGVVIVCLLAVSQYEPPPTPIPPAPDVVVGAVETVVVATFRTWAEKSAEIASKAKTMEPDAAYDYVAEKAGPAFDEAYKPLNTLTDAAVKNKTYVELMGQIENGYRAVAKRLEK